MMSGGTNLPVLGDLGRGSQMPYPYDAYPLQDFLGALHESPSACSGRLLASNLRRAGLVRLRVQCVTGERSPARGCRGQSGRCLHGAAAGAGVRRRQCHWFQHPLLRAGRLLLSIAAIGSQFSAAVADNSGAGGLLEEITHHRLPIRYAYLLILLVAVALTWETDVNGIIAYASRAFALYYMLQCVVALLIARQVSGLPRRGLRMASYAVLAGVCLLVFALGLPAE